MTDSTAPMNQHPDNEALYRALVSRDSRFDGIFFVGVSSTGIYCRPICPAKKPKPENCHFFRTVEAAENASFRPCLRCRPELAPGFAPVDDSRRIAEAIATELEQGAASGSSSIEDIADLFELSSRQIRRIIQHEFGVSPMELVLTRRLLLAKQLLTETSMPINHVATASGFLSVRRFNDAFAKRNGVQPTQVRRAAMNLDNVPSLSPTISLRFSYRPPYHWDALLQFLGNRLVAGVEHVHDHQYLRTVSIGEYTGWIRVGNRPERNELTAELGQSLLPVLPVLMKKLRNLFDLDARPDIIEAHLSQHQHFEHSIVNLPGLRVPGAFNGFEMAVRAILGQQITVKAATTLSCRFASRFGKAIETPFPELTHLSPTPDRIAAASIDDIASLGIIRNRTRSIIALAQEMVAGRLRLEPGQDPGQTIQKLVVIPGVGQWTAQYIVMRALGYPDAFPKEDIVLRKVLGNVSAVGGEALSAPWRPWRSYATMHLWQAAGNGLELVTP